MQVDVETLFQIPARSLSGDCSAELKQFPFINHDFFKNEIVPNQVFRSCLASLDKVLVLHQLFIL